MKSDLLLTGSILLFTIPSATRAVVNDWKKEDFEQFEPGQFVKTIKREEDGLTILARVSYNGVYDYPMIFSSSSPTANHYDLGAPNTEYGSPGTGEGGESNNSTQGKVLIISEDDNAIDPDARSRGGMFLFTFKPPMILKNVGILNNNNGFKVVVLDSFNQVIHNEKYPPLGENSFQFAELLLENASKMRVQLFGPAAITEIGYKMP